MGVKMADIAKTSGFSVTTVSRVLSGHAKDFRITKGTAEKIKAVAEKMGYRPSQLARGLRTSQTFNIGFGNFQFM